MKKAQHRIALLWGVAGACLVLSAAAFFWIGGIFTNDMAIHRTMFAYILRGVDPNQWIGKQPLFPDLRVIRVGFSTVPWAGILGIGFYAPFLPMLYSKIAVVAWHLVSLAAATCALMRRFSPALPGKKRYLIPVLMAAQFAFFFSLHHGNMGAPICYLMILALLTLDTAPVLSGIMIGLTMVKPQLSAILCLIILLNKKYIPLLVGAGLALAGWILTAALTHVGPMKLFVDAFLCGTASPSQYLGLLSVLRYFLPLGDGAILALNAGIGCVYSIWLWQVLRKSGVGADSLVLYIPACFASTFWFYKNGPDYAILALGSILLYCLCLAPEVSGRRFALCLFMAAYLEISRIAVYMGVLLSETDLGRDLFKSLDGLILMLIGIYLCRAWVREGRGPAAAFPNGGAAGAKI